MPISVLKNRRKFLSRTLHFRLRTRGDPLYRVHDWSTIMIKCKTGVYFEMVARGENFRPWKNADKGWLLNLSTARLGPGARQHNVLQAGTRFSFPSLFLFPLFIFLFLSFFAFFIFFPSRRCRTGLDLNVVTRFTLVHQHNHTRVPCFVSIPSTT